MTRAQLAEKVRQRAEQTGASVVHHDVRRGVDRGRRRSLKLLARRVLRLATLFILDGLVIATSYVIALAAVQGSGETAPRLLLPIAVGVSWLGLIAFGTYRPGANRHDPLRLTLAVGLAVVLLWIQAELLPDVWAGGWWLGLFAVLVLPLLIVERWIVQQAVLALRRRGYLHRRALVVGEAADAWDVLRSSRSEPDSDLVFVDHLASSPGSGSAAERGFEDLERIIEESDVELVVLACEDKDPALEELIERSLAAGVPVVALTSVTRRLAACIGHAGDLFGPSALEIRPPALRLPELSLKRVFDLIVAVVTLVLLAPLFLLVAVAIVLDSRGPVFFTQTRVGLGGHLFTMIKFRSMYVDAEERKKELLHLNQYGDGRLFKIAGDPRVTRVGAFLRHWSIDELPQLFNVVIGDMSLVGPRPPIPEEVVSYEGHHFERLTVQPGVTGPWQANGRNNIQDFERVVQMERDYIERWSFLLDLKILAKTVGVVLRGEGAH